MSSSERPKSTLFDDLKTRTGVAIVMAVVSFGFLWVGGLPFALFMGVVALMMLLEFTSLIRSDFHPNDHTGWLCSDCDWCGRGGLFAGSAAWI